jgi:NitT/TauT family transport system substrate-binding protein
MIEFRSISLAALVSAALLLNVSSGEAQAATQIRYALGDVVSVDELPLLVAVERAKKRGVNVAITSFKSEEVATQAVINGQATSARAHPTRPCRR